VEDAPSDLLGAHAVKGHLHDNGLMGEHTTHVQNRARSGQQDPKMLLISVQEVAQRGSIDVQQLLQLVSTPYYCHASPVMRSS